MCINLYLVIQVIQISLGKQTTYFKLNLLCLPNVRFRLVLVQACSVSGVEHDPMTPPHPSPTDWFTLSLTLPPPLFHNTMPCSNSAIRMNFSISPTVLWSFGFVLVNKFQNCSCSQNTSMDVSTLRLEPHTYRQT